MNKITDNDIARLIEHAKTATSSGHPFLDARWTSEGADGRNSHYRRSYYRFCQQLVREFKPNLVVELGIDEGDCSGHFASGNPETQVLGVDVHKDGEAPSLRCREVEKQFQNFKYLRGWTWEKASEVAQYGLIDILMIDSWHEYDYAGHDWNLYAHLLAENAIVLIDDLHMGGVKLFWAELIGERVGYLNTKPALTHVDHTMNPAVPYGIVVGVNKNYRFNVVKQEYMP